MGNLYDLNDVKKKIESGKILLIAGDEHLLKQLPKGRWIGGTIPYFMEEDGGLSTKEMMFLTELPEYIEEVSIKTYDKSSISNINLDEPEKNLEGNIVGMLSFTFADDNTS